LEQVEKWLNNSQDYFESIRGGQAYIVNRMRGVPIVAVALVTFKFQCTDAKAFWHEVAYAKDLKQGMPAQVLVSLLMQTNVRKMGREAMSRRVARCWNAFFERRSLERSQVRNTTALIEIAGTPFVAHRKEDQVMLNF